MKCNPLRWWWGLLPVAALVWLAFIWEREPIQQDLRVRTHEALTEAGLTWAGTAFDGRDGLLKGLAFRDEQPVRATEIVSKVWGVRVVEQQIDLIDYVDNYAWAAETADEVIILTGYAPNEDARIKLRKLVEARFPGFKIDDKTTLARGAPALPAWTGVIGFGLDRLSQMKSGKLQLSGLALSISGEARDFGAYKSATAALESAVPEGVTVSKNDIRPPIVSPYTWTASRSATHLILSGHVPSEQHRERIFSLAKKAHPSVVIIDRMETGAGAPDGWELAVDTTISQIARMEAGVGQISDRDLSLNGKAPDEDTANAIASEIGDAIPKAFRFRHSIEFPEPKPPIVSPFTTSIEASGDVIYLTGFVPNEQHRASLLIAAGKAFAGRRIDDALELGSGEPEGWRRCVLAGIDATGKLGTGTASLRDRFLKITATTSNEELAAALPGDVRAATTRACESEVLLALDLPKEPDLSWRAIYEGESSLVLDGEVPGLETMTLLLSTARKQFPKVEIVNRMRIAGGYATKWRKAAAHGIALLRLLRRGEASLSGQSLVITGEAADTAAATAVKDRLSHNMPKNYFGREFISVKSDAMIWAEVEAKRKADDAARLKAEELEKAKRQKEAEEAAREAVEEASQQEKTEKATARPDVEDDAEARRRLDDVLARREAERKTAEEQSADAEAAKVRAAEDAAERKTSQAAETRRKLAELLARREADREAAARKTANDRAELRRIAEQEAKHKARVEAERQANAKEEAIRHAEQEAARRKASAEAQAAIARDRRTATSQRQPIPAEAFNCQKRLSEAVKSGVILFDYASSELSANSRPTLDKLAKIAKSCPEVDLAVEGHTDSIGQRSDNRQLSLHRSEAVIKYLVGVGIARSRLRPVGYGEDHPVAPNNTASNRARNRRIEFSIDING